MNKPKVIIYVNPDAKSTEILTNFISKHIDRINHFLTIQLN